jgi:MinD-like ATPase involved in chromosome partitioning or flagellar assembly
MEPQDTRTAPPERKLSAPRDRDLEDEGEVKDLGLRNGAADLEEEAADLPPEPVAAGEAPRLRREGPISRDEVYTSPVVHGRVVRDSPVRRLIEQARWMLTSKLEREELALEQTLASVPPVTRPNVVAIMSPKGGVGKTTSTFLMGNLLASRLKMRVVGIDANPDFGTLASLAPDAVRSERSMADLLPHLEEIEAAAELRPFMSCLPTGMHLLAAPADLSQMAQITTERYEELLQVLAHYYDVALLDLGTGITAPVSQWAMERADQLVLITTPEWVTSFSVSRALRHLSVKQATLVLNQASRNAADRIAIERHFHKQWLEQRVMIPYDQRLRMMLDSGTYSLEELSRPTRVPIKQLGVAISQNLL